MLQSHRVRTLDQVRSFLDGTEPVEVHPLERSARYEFVARTLRRFGYGQPGKADKGVVRRFAGKVSGWSRAQLTRLIAQYRATGRLRDRRGPPRRPFPRRYPREDIRRLAQVDALHGTLSGPATRKRCERADTVFHDPRFERLAGLSNGHLYHLRHSTPCQRRRGKVAPTRPTTVSIGERRRPHPQGRPGFVRVDTVHQGDFDGAKGLYPLNLVDEVTQLQFIGSCERITERFLVPVLEGLLGSFPFTIEAFPADNGPEFINHQVARPAHQRQCPGREQERLGGAQTLRLRPPPGSIRPRSQPLRSARPVPRSELPPPLPLPHRDHRPQGTSAEALPIPGLGHPLREAQITARRSALPHRALPLRAPRRTRLRTERP